MASPVFIFRDLSVATGTAFLRRGSACWQCPDLASCSPRSTAEGESVVGVFPGAWALATTTEQQEKSKTSDRIIVPSFAQSRGAKAMRQARVNACLIIHPRQCPFRTSEYELQGELNVAFALRSGDQPHGRAASQVRWRGKRIRRTRRKVVSAIRVRCGENDVVKGV